MTLQSAIQYCISVGSSQSEASPVFAVGASLCHYVVQSVPVVGLMECIMLDLHKAQRPEDKDWFKETREAKFGPLDQVDTTAIVSNLL